MQKIHKYKVRLSGTRGLTLTIPKVWSSDHNIKSGDIISVYRADIRGDDVLVIKKEK